MEITTPNEKLSTKREVNWFKILFQVQVNIAGLVAAYVIIRNGCMWTTFIFSMFVVFLGWLGEAAGAHRLWTHQSYKASTSLRLFLMICQTVVGNGTIYSWVQWHRLNHKYYKTKLDPYNPKNGFYYAHIVGSLEYFSPAQTKALEEIDMKDIEEDKIVMFQKKWYYLLFFLFAFLLPTNAPAEYWSENLTLSLLVVGWFRYMISIHLSSLINSACLIWDLQPGEKYPADTNLVFIITKTYWISYHYLAPWDYQTSEFGKYGTDLISKFIRVCAALELAHDLKTIDSRSIRLALTKSLVENKNITECLLEISENDQLLKKEHYLEPAKHY